MDWIDQLSRSWEREYPDLETSALALSAAETGHLVLSTLHTVDAGQTVERIIDMYPAGQQNQIRAMLGNTLQAVVSQTLFKRVDRAGRGVVGAGHRTGCRVSGLGCGRIPGGCRPD